MSKKKKNKIFFLTVNKAPHFIYDKKAQITIFIILGLLILFAFLFMMQLTNQVKKEELQSSREEVFGKTFKKESMRIFVEDCLYDGLEEGIILLSKQGRLWRDQPGGARDFVENVTGVYVGDDRVYYGITRREYLPEQNAYPCNNQSNSPLFCNYFYPDAQAKFGELALRQSSIISDLRRFIENKTKECVINYTLTNVSSAAVLEQTTMDLTMELQNEGITVKVIYPLKFKVAGEEFFHLTTFDFFYPTKFKLLLDSAVTAPLQWDQEYLDFNYTRGQLEKEEFSYKTDQNFPHCPGGFCTLRTKSKVYGSLGISMDRTSLPSGDDIFTFTPAANQVIHSPEPYYFRIARQNRPPALDLVNRSQCRDPDSDGSLDYDYLVIQGEDWPWGGINITLFALDPDEDEVAYSFDLSQFPFSVGSVLSEKNIHLQVNPDEVKKIDKKIYTLKASATETETTIPLSLSDWQDVRVLIDRPIKVDVSLNLPYAGVTTESSPGSGYYFVSREDPVFVTIGYPEESELDEVTASQKITLRYSPNEEESVEYELPDRRLIRGADGCYSFPGKDSTFSCNADIGEYKGYVEDWFTDGDFSLFKEKTSNGKLSLSFSAEYCHNFNVGNSAEVNVIVKDCVAYRNPYYPFAAPYEKYVKKADGTIAFDNSVDINPLTATHSCCSGDPTNPASWTMVLAQETQKCFSNPERKCYDPLAPYLWQEEFVLCNGERGNYCGGEKQYAPWNGEMKCGENTKGDCKNIIPPCQNQIAFGLLSGISTPSGKGWCHGTYGCQKLCGNSADDELVDLSGTLGGKTVDIDYFNNIAEANDYKSETELNLACGCGRATQGKPCDSNFDGTFENVCNGNMCGPLGSVGPGY